MNINITFPILESDHGSNYESLANVSVIHETGKTHHFDIDGVDAHYRVTVEVDHGDVIVKLHDQKAETLIAQGIATKQDYDIQLPPDAALLAEWSDDIKGAFTYVSTSLIALEDVIEVFSKLPITDVWAETPQGGSQLELTIELARSLTMLESFTLLQLEPKRLNIQDDNQTIGLIWD